MRLLEERGTLHSRMFSGGGMGLALLAGILVLGGGSASAGESSGHSVYKSGKKPVLSYILSQPKNAKEFQTEFALSEDQMKQVETAIVAENETLAKVYAASERIVESHRNLPKRQIAKKISASSYDENVARAIAHTKNRVKKVLPPGHRQELESWVDAAWKREQRQAASENSGYQFSSLEVTYKVWATQYNGYSRYEVALPHQKLKFDGGYRVRITRNGNRAWAPVKEVGPWNTRDNYWQSSRYRDMWKDLPRGTAEARAAYFRNYHHGKDQFGRRVLNPASIDLTPAVARKVGLKKYASGSVYVYYPWVRK